MLDKSDIISKLNANKRKSMRKCESDLLVEESIQVAEKESNHFLPYLVLMSGSSGNWCVFHTGKLPKGWEVDNFPSGNGWFKVSVTKEDSDTLKEAIISYKKYKHYYTQPYSHIVAYCLGKGLDLVGKGILEL